MIGISETITVSTLEFIRNINQKINEKKENINDDMVFEIKLLE